MTVKIGLIGAYSPKVTAHGVIPKAITPAACETNCESEGLRKLAEDERK